MADNILQRIVKPSARGKLWRTFILVMILTLIGFFVVTGDYYNKAANFVADKTGQTVNLPRTGEMPFRLGLDLQGGTHLVYEADVSAVDLKDRNDAVEGARDVIERRINVFGVAEPIVQVNHSATGDYRIIAELAGIKNVDEAIKMIGETPILEFKEQAEKQRELTTDEQKTIEEFNKQADNKAEEVLGKAISGGDFNALAKQYSDAEGAKDNGGDLGWITESANPEIVGIAKKLNKGQTTNDLVNVQGGYEIVKLEDKRQKTDPFTNQPEKEISAQHLLICFEGIENCESGLTKEEAYEKIKKLKDQATPRNFSELVKQNSTEPGAKESFGDLGWFGRDAMVKPFEDAVFEQQTGTISYVVETQFGYHIIYKKAERNIEEYKVSHIAIKTLSAADILGQAQDWANTELTGKNLKRATVQFNPNDNSPEVSLEFDEQGSKFFEDITARNIGKQVAIFLDNYPISIPSVGEKITGGKASISGNFNIKEAKVLAQRLNAGALPIPISLVSQQTVGASLGQKSISNSLQAGIIGLILVGLFMILYYRLPGFVAVLSLFVYGLLVLAIFKAIPIWLSLALIVLFSGLLTVTFSELKILDTFLTIIIVITGILLFSFSYNSVTLTLAGLAGFILSIGIAVDANILIFERMKDELKKGKPLALASEEGFRRAWPSIRDGNITTILVCFVLMLFGTGSVQGFGTILFIGVSVSMFSAIVVTRNFMGLIMGNWLEKRGWLVGARAKAIETDKN